LDHVGLGIADTKRSIRSGDATSFACRTCLQWIVTGTAAIKCAGTSLRRVIDHGNRPRFRRNRPCRHRVCKSMASSMFHLTRKRLHPGDVVMYRSIGASACGSRRDSTAGSLDVRVPTKPFSNRYEPVRKSSPTNLHADPRSVSGVLCRVLFIMQTDGPTGKLCWLACYFARRSW
jgi:hypothetical protein